MADGKNIDHSDAEGSAAASQGGRAPHASLRQCAVTRAELPPEDLIRFVKAPDGTLTPDLDQRLPGRGVWVLCDRKILEKAIKNKVFSRSLHDAVGVPADLADRVDMLLARRALEALSLANKAGLVLAGFDKVDAALGKGSISVLMHGRDAAADGRGKLDRKFTAVNREKGQKAQIIDVFDSAQMSLAIGRPSVVHAALIPGGLTKRFRREAERFQRYRSASAQCQSFDTLGQIQDRTENRNEG